MFGQGAHAVANPTPSSIISERFGCDTVVMARVQRVSGGLLGLAGAFAVLLGAVPAADLAAGPEHARERAVGIPRANRLSLGSAVSDTAAGDPFAPAAAAGPAAQWRSPLLSLALCPPAKRHGSETGTSLDS